MASSRKDPILPVATTTSIAMYLEDLEKFNTFVLWNDKQRNFFIEKRTVKGTEIIFEIRSMRVNEFVDLLDGNKIPWREVKEKYK